ncbi:unnamed protein product [Rotaria sp. Silwood1]|nr:unnamed protein product [Rotaria sp. Silwood1]
MSNSDKDSIRKRLDSGEYKSCDKSTTASAEWWKSFNRIQDEKENIIPYVICIHCKSVLAYDSQKTSSKTLKLHFENCKSKLTITTPKITAHFTSEKYNHVASKHIKKVLNECVKFCAYGMRSFNSVNGHGLEFLVQDLLHVAYSTDVKIKGSDIIPHSTTISRRVQSMACDERRKLIITLKNDIGQALCIVGTISEISESGITKGIQETRRGAVIGEGLLSILFYSFGIFVAYRYYETGAIERIDVAGGQGNALAQSSRPRGVLVDQFDTVYVADCDNNRVMRWSKDTKQGTVPVSGNNQDEQLNQFYFPQDLSFDRHSNLYIVDYANARIQRFNIGSSSS